MKKNTGGKNQDEEKIMVEDAINTGEPKFRWKKIWGGKKCIKLFSSWRISGVKNLGVKKKFRNIK